MAARAILWFLPALASLATIAGAQTFAVDDFVTGRSETRVRAPQPRTNTVRRALDASSTTDCSTTGPQNIAVLTVTTPANPALPSAWNNAAIQQAYFAQSGLSLNTYWQDASYGQTSATGSVFGPYRLSSNYDCSNLDGLASAAIAAASSVDFTRYTRIGIVFPVQSCVLPGFGGIGGYGSIGCYNVPPIPQNVAVAWLPIPSAWATPANSVGILAHEHGHNLGLHHGNTEDFGTLPLGPPDTTGTNTEYGDPFSVMGNADIQSTRPTFGQYSAEHKALELNWLQQPSYLEVQTSGTFTIAPYESSSGTRALRILRDPVAGSWLWIEYRQPQGTVDTTLSNLSGAKTSNVFNGALVHYENPNLDSLHTYLLDFHPPSTPNTFYTAALTPGQTWSDPSSLLTLKVNSASAAGLSVTATWDTPCASATLSGTAVTVTAPSNCNWTASTASSWITLHGASSGTGSATIPYTLAANTTANQRLGFITAARQSLALLQAGTSISITALNPLVRNVNPADMAIQISDPLGAGDIAAAYITFSGAPACAVTVNTTAKTFSLANDAGTALLGPTSSATLSNSVCSVLAAQSSVTGSGTQLTIDLEMSFTPAFGGSHHITTVAQTSAGQVATLTMGTWTIPSASTPALTGFSPLQITAGASAFLLTATGTNFTPAENIQWNGTALTTTFVNATTLTATVPANLLATAGAVSLSVSGAPGSAGFTISATVPTVTSISPTSATAGAAGFTLAVLGSGFSSANTLLWNGAALPTTFVSATQLTASVPATLLTTAGTESVTISLGTGTATFTINPASPAVTSISPSTAIAGSPGIVLTVTGTGFTAGSIVAWNGTALATTFVSATQLTATVPASLLTSAGSATVTVSGGIGSAVFTINAAPPAMASINPTSATAGSAAITLTVTGTSFNAGSTVAWNGTALATTFVSAAQLTATVPASLLATAGSATVTVSGGSGSATFTINPAPPAVISINPTTATAGTAAITLTVAGTGFTAGSVVTWNGTALTTTFVSATHLTAAVPASLLVSSGSATVAVRGGTGSAAFTITPPAPPLLSSIGPTTATAGSSAITLTVTGTGFTAASAVGWNGTALTTTFASSTQLSVVIPASLLAVPGSASISIAGGNGFATFTIAAPVPTVDSGGIVPIGSTVPTVAPGSWISIYGTDLASGVFNWDGSYPTTLGGVSVLIDGKPAFLSYVSPRQINVLAPADSASGTVPVFVTTPNGTVTSTVTLAAVHPTLLPLDTHYAVVVIPAPDGSYTIAGTANPIPPGTTVELFGEGFGPTVPPVVPGQPFSGAPATANRVTVTIGGVNAQVTYAGMILNGLYQINVTIPSLPAGDQQILASVSGFGTSTGLCLPVGH